MRTQLSLRRLPLLAGGVLLVLGMAGGMFTGARAASAAGITVRSGDVRAAAATINPLGPDLTVSITGTAFNQFSNTDILWSPGETLTYTLTIHNTTQSVRVCQPADDLVLKPYCFTEVIGAAASGVVVQDTLLAGVTLQCRRRGGDMLRWRNC